ncbi:hypothetical protein BCR41DRAFT_364757 [Lobosporangium transversale]|uniref:Uncharacterized protein n=1 Tax=Lobosporangium transversale TaxID=64571 RepID=A0A1Y2G620_9FUNG|nr:hypothetical protein BCR41DRAFT_364757 [Lobosporangium transversale]ORY96988.1 hypothetical protein BCR41DRAFT_364757 [Lobosporangium transversale]|eukprot:XP_021875550.1 hypothetical protein BCR41DRAFT_364757 [Lobosporangium transversale]
MNTTSVGDDEYCQDKTRFRLFKGLRVATAAPRQGCPDIRAFKHADTKNRVVESPLFRQSSTPLSQIPIKYHAEDQVKIPPSPSPQPQWRRAPSTGVSIGQSPLEPSLSQRSQQEEAGSFPTQYPIRQQTPSQANPQHQTNDQPGRQISSTVFADVLNVLTQREEHNQPCPFVVYCTYIERVEHLHHGVQGCCCTSQRPQSHCGAANESNT